MDCKTLSPNDTCVKIIILIITNSRQQNSNLALSLFATYAPLNTPLLNLIVNLIQLQILDKDESHKRTNSPCRPITRPGRKWTSEDARNPCPTLLNWFMNASVYAFKRALKGHFRKQEGRHGVNKSGVL